uniref:Uncharacterized protein n=1 Tax=Glossina austeni TaxID=7395 RepID=A0A1A9VEV1_GLOAU
MELHDVFNLVLGGGEAIFKLPVLPLKAVFNLAAWATAAAAEFIKLSGKMFITFVFNKNCTPLTLPSEPRPFCFNFERLLTFGLDGLAIGANLGILTIEFNNVTVPGIGPVPTIADIFIPLTAAAVASTNCCWCFWCWAASTTKLHLGFHLDKIFLENSFSLDNSDNTYGILHSNFRQFWEKYGLHQMIYKQGIKIWATGGKNHLKEIEK